MGCAWNVVGVANNKWAEREKIKAKRWEMRSAGTRCQTKPGLLWLVDFVG